MIANLLPARVRKVVYVVLATAFGIEAVLQVVPDGIESKVLGVIGVLGFTLAAGNTNTASTVTTTTTIEEPTP